MGVGSARMRSYCLIGEEFQFCKTERVLGMEVGQHVMVLSATELYTSKQVRR